MHTLLSQCALVLVVAFPAALFAAAPPAINYQGRVLAPDGSPAPGPVDITLRIWDSATAGTQLYEEQHRSTALTDGIFDVLLGAGTDRAGTLDADTFVMADRWLELSINGEPLTPRQPFSSVPYAFQAQRAERATSADMIGSLTAADIVPRAGGTFTGVIGLNGPNGKGNVLLSHLVSNPDHGFVSVQNADGASRADMFVSAAGEGVLRAANAAGQYGALITSDSNGGLLSVSSANVSRADMFVNAKGEGIVRAANAAGQFGAVLTSGDSGGVVSVSDTGGKIGGTMSIGSNGGIISSLDTAGNVGAFLSNGSNGGLIAAGRGSNIGAIMSMLTNGGSVSVLDKNGNTKAGMLINASNQGRIFADVKNFVVDHPTRPGFQIVYASLEGPEAAIYHRGTVLLSNGRATIELPEHFTVMAAPGTLTVQLTPESLDSQGLGFRRIDDAHLGVGELHGGQGSYPVHFVVHAVRRGYEDYRPVVGGEAALGAGGTAAGQDAAAMPALHVSIAEARTAAQEAAALRGPTLQQP